MNRQKNNIGAAKDIDPLFGNIGDAIWHEVLENVAFPIRNEIFDETYVSVGLEIHELHNEYYN